MGSKKEKEDEDWRNSPARLMIVSDLDAGVLPHLATDMPAKDVWNVVYSKCLEFQGMEYAKFRDRLNRLRKAHGVNRLRAARDKAALQNDRRLHPRKTTNHRGEPVFDLSAAKPLLRLDVKNKRHERMALSELRISRPEYTIFPQRIFSERVRQEIRRQKFIHHLEIQRGATSDSIDKLGAAFQKLGVAPTKQEKRQGDVEEYAKAKQVAVAKRRSEAKRKTTTSSRAPAGKQQKKRKENK